MLSWFVAAVPAHRAKQEGGLCYLLGHSLKTNHGKPCNMETHVRDGCLNHEASCDMKIGDELLLDYTTMEMPQFCKDWMASNNLMDNQTMAESVEGSSQPAAVILPWKTNSVAGFRVQVEVKASGIPGA